MNKEYTKNCPKCGEVLEYTNKFNCERSIKNNSFCYSCNLSYKRSTKETRERTKIKFKKKKNKINKYEYNNNPLKKISSNISSSMRNSLKSNRLSKNGRHWENIVGYSVQELKEHLEKLFKPGMNWRNKGKNGWHIDHRIPINFFQYNSTDDVEFKYCWSLNNLQPLWEKDNVRKNDRIMLWGKQIKTNDINRDYFSKITSVY